MSLDIFVKNVAEQFDETDPSLFNPDTAFKSIDEWSSLTALSIIAMVDDEYEVQIKGDDIRSAETIEDLYKIVKGKE